MCRKCNFFVMESNRDERPPMKMERVQSALILSFGFGFHSSKIHKSKML